MTLLNDATAWIERSIPPSITTKVIPAARMNKVAVSAITTRRVSNVRKLRCSVPIRMTNPSKSKTGIAARRVPTGRNDFAAVGFGVIGRFGRRFGGGGNHRLHRFHGLEEGT